MLVLRCKTGGEIRKVVWSWLRRTLMIPSRSRRCSSFAAAWFCEDVFGRVFIAADDTDEFEGLAFLARAGEPAHC
jgi:hypothetical protein